MKSGGNPNVLINEIFDIIVYRLVLCLSSVFRVD